MAINDVMGLTLDISANTDKFCKDLQRAAANVSLDFDPKPMVKRFSRAQKDIQGILANSVAAAATAGFDRMKIDGFRKKMAGTAEAIEKQLDVVFKKQLEMRSKGITEERKIALATEQDKLRELKKRLSLEKKTVEENIEKQKKAVEEAERLAKRGRAQAAKEMAEVGEDFAKGIEGAFSRIKGGDVGGLLKGVGGGASKAGKGMQLRADAMKAAGKGGGMAKMLGSLGGMLAKIGPAIAAIGAIAAGIGAVVAIAVAADSAMKGLNKTLMDSGVSGADLANEFGILGNTMDRIRSTFTDSFTFNRIWGTTAKDHLEILGAYASAGLTFKEMTQGVKSAGEEMSRLKEYTVAALTYSKLLGMSTQEVSGTMASYMEELGLTLDGVRKRFSNIIVAAKESGFSTKRFFNMILQATSGMSMYNVRLEEAAGLLINLGRILGEKMGGDFLQNLMKGFKDESTTDRIKKTMTTGVGYSLKILKEDAMKSSEEFVRKLDELGTKNADAQKGMTELLGKYNVSTDPKKMAQDLAKLNQDPKKMAALLAKSRALDPGMGRMLANLSNKSTAFQGGLGGAQAARQFAGGNASLLLQLSEMRKVAKGKRLDQIDLKDMKMRAAWENITGKSGEESLKLFEVGRDFAGRQEALSEAQAQIKAADAAGDTEKAKSLSAEFNKQFGEKFGVILDESGNRFKAVLDPSGRVDEFASLAGKKLADTFEALVMSQGDEVKGKEEQKVAEDILLAQEIAGNTTDMAKILEQGIEWLLSKIYNAVQYIASFFGKEEFEDEEKAALGKAQGEIMDKLVEDKTQIRAQQTAIKDLERRKRTASDEEKAEMDVEIKERKTKIDQLSGRSAVYSAAGRELGRMDAEYAYQFKQGDEDMDAEALIGAAATKPSVRKAIAEGVKKLKPHVDVAKHAKEARDWEEHGKAVTAGTYRPWTLTRHIAKGEAKEYGQRREDQVFSGYSHDFFGLPSSVRGVDSSMFSAFEFKDMPASVGGGKKALTTPELVGEKLYIKKEDESTKAAERRQKAGEKAEEKGKVKLAKDIVEGIAKSKKEDETKELAALLGSYGEVGGYETLLGKAELIRAGKRAPGFDPNRIVGAGPDGKGGQRLGDLLLQSGKTGKGAGVLKKSDKAKDYMVHIDSSGRVVSAQKVTAGDTMYAATMGGGAMSQATRVAGRSRGGGGGTTIVQHIYAGDEAARKGFRTLANARALG